MLARMWPIRIPSRIGTRTEIKNDPGLDTSKFTEYSETVHTMLSADTRTASGRKVTHLARLSDGADDVRILFANNIESNMTKRLEASADIANKATSQMVKLAALIHIAESPELLRDEQSTISKMDMERAYALTQYYIHEAVSIREESTTQDRHIIMAKAAIKKMCQIGGGQKIKAGRDIQRVIRPRPYDAKEATLVLDLLEEYGWCRSAEGKKDRRASRTWTIHPHIAEYTEDESTDA